MTFCEIKLAAGAEQKGNIINMCENSQNTHIKTITEGKKAQSFYLALFFILDKDK